MKDSIRAFYPGRSPEASDFSPLPEFVRHDADVNLIFLQNHANYRYEVDDPWFSASEYNATIGYYRYLNPINVLGCAERYEFCGGRSSNCTSLTSIGLLNRTLNSSHVGFTSRQKALAQHFLVFLSFLSLREFWSASPSSYLLASRSQVNPGSIIPLPLPATQWMMEVQNWHKLLQIALQRSIMDYATGPTNSQWESSVIRPPSSFSHDLCRSQILHDSTYSSFSIFGIVVIFAVGGMIIILELLAPAVHRRLFRNRNPNVQDLWLFDDYLHLQQRAFEEAGVGKWYGRAKPVPTTYRYETFAPLQNARRKIVKLEVVNVPSSVILSPYDYDHSLLPAPLRIRKRTS